MSLNNNNNNNNTKNNNTNNNNNLFIFKTITCINILKNTKIQA